MKTQMIWNNKTDFALTEEYKKCFQKCADTVFQGNEKNYEIGLNIVDEKEIQWLNRDYRGIDKATDVLSFLLDDEDIAENEGYVYLGDVVICAEKALAQADEYGHSMLREMMYLFVHALLHLKGYDHMNEADKAQMRAEEEKIMQAAGLEREHIKNEK